jgi:hypothetical protein
MNNASWIWWWNNGGYIWGGKEKKIMFEEKLMLVLGFTSWHTSLELEG